MTPSTARPVPCDTSIPHGPRGKAETLILAAAARRAIMVREREDLTGTRRQAPMSTGKPHGPITAAQHNFILSLDTCWVRSVGYDYHAYWCPGYVDHRGEFFPIP